MSLALESNYANAGVNKKAAFKDLNTFSVSLNHLKFIPFLVKRIKEAINIKNFLIKFW